MDALEYVEILATLDRQIAGLEDLLKTREMPADTQHLVIAAAARWHKIREIIAKQNEPHPVSAPQAATLIRAISVMQSVARSICHPYDDQARDLELITQQIRQSFGDLHAK